MAENPKECPCFLCKRHRALRAILAGRDFDALAKYVEELETENMCQGEDLCVYRAVLDGNWGGAIRRLEAALEHARTEEANRGREP